MLQTDDKTRLTYDPARLALMFDQIVRNGGDPGGKAKAQRIDSLVVHESLRKLELKPDDALLDLGCGTGRILLGAAGAIRWGYGVDISRESLALARKRAAAAGAKTLHFAYGSIEHPSVEIDLKASGVNKALLLWALHHLPDDLKGSALLNLSRLIRKPGRLVIGDLMFFEDPEKHRLIWDRVGYDGGVTDYPTTADWLRRTLMRLGASIEITRLHPLVGVVAAIWE